MSVSRFRTYRVRFGARFAAVAFVAGAALAGRDAQAAGGSTFYGYTTTGAVTASSGANGTEYTYGSDFKVYNNQWGIPFNGQGSSTVFTETVNNEPGAGWAYDVTSGTGVVMFPEVAYGWTPNGNASWGGNPIIPQISEGQSITAAFKMASQHSAGSTWDFAYDIWITSSNQPSSTVGSFELMIWLDHENQDPWDTHGPQGLVTFGGVTFQRYTNAGAADWTCLSYVNQGPGLYQSSNFSISDVVNDAAAKFNIPSSFYVASIEFGNEVIVGSGMTEIFQWEINVSSEAADAGSGEAGTGAIDAGAEGGGGSIDAGASELDATGVEDAGQAVYVDASAIPDASSPVHDSSAVQDASTGGVGETPGGTGGHSGGCSLGGPAGRDSLFAPVIGIGFLLLRKRRPRA